MSHTPRQLLLAAVVLAIAIALGFLQRDASVYFAIVGAVGAGAVLAASVASQPRGLRELPAAVAMIARGERPVLPQEPGPDIERVIEQVSGLAERAQREQDAARNLTAMLDALRGSLRDAADGRVPVVPAGLHPEAQPLLEQVGRLAGSISEARKMASSRMAALDQHARKLDETVESLGDGLARRAGFAQEAANAVVQVTASMQDLARHVDVLATTADDSAGSIVRMMTTTDEVTSSIGELASNVRETASSIEEMAYSIKEVAKNVDALSLTAEETSSSMNEMDVSIDQVQSNANETARLSEEVAQDAERGAESILKTIGEIYRIKESTQEAVSVISNLGSRIDAIGQILNVIDDVAEQTNLLALNAAIIAAQAGEHGKGFAVVADEIKDLAERAGASTKEIAELTKTIQNESKNAIAAVERGAKNVDRGVEVSNEAEHALKKILESSQKSTNMVRAIARATVEQAKGSRQVTDAIGRIAETVQQIAAATAQQARGSELIMRSVEKMRSITQQVERSGQEQSRGGRQVTTAIEHIAGLVEQLKDAQRSLSRSGEALVAAASRIEKSVRDEEAILRQLTGETSRLRATPSERAKNA
ncbi:MAG: methyl-accepting chemotaxis protein [Polyangiaceae bacterium]|nr:methyl-accepting chemotaxis protein [Polyangiaceae bacterium]